MSHHCHHEGRCPMRPFYALAAALGLLLLAAAYLFGCPASPLARKPEPIDLSALATKEELLALRDEGLSLFGGLKSEVVRAADIEIDGVKKESHKLRKALADELRKESEAAIHSAIEAERSTRGHQITAEISKRRNETGELFEARNKTYDALLRHQGEIIALRKQLFALEQWQLKHRCPEPCKCSHTPPVPAKVLPAPAPNMYTIPYQGAYVAPRCR